MSQSEDETSAVRYDEFGVELELDIPTTIDISETVALTMKLRNVSPESIEMLTGGIPSDDFVVIEEGGSVIWNSRTGTADVLLQVRLDPGEEETYTEHWTPNDDSPEIEPGTYQVMGKLWLETPDVLETGVVTIALVD